MENNAFHGGFDELTHNVLGFIGDGVITTDVYGNILYVNPAAEEIIGFRLEKIRGRKFDDMIVVFDRESGRILESPIQRAILTKQPVGLSNNSVIRMKSGKVKYVSASCSPVKSSAGDIVGVVLAIRDITRLKTNELLQIVEKNNFKTIFDNAPVGMVIIDEKFRIHNINASALDWIGRDISEVIGKLFGNGLGCKWLANGNSCGDMLHCEHCEFRTSVETAIHESESVECEELNRIFVIRGKEVNQWLRINVSPIIINSVYYAVMTIVNITKVKNSEIALKISEERYRSLFAYADKASRAKSEFLSNMSHEIKTPINGVLGMIEITMLTDLNHEQRQNLGIAMSCGTSLLKIINNILDYSKIDSGKLFLEYQEMNLNAIVNEVVNGYMEKATLKNLSLNIYNHINPDQFVITDRSRFRQILDNLVGNAVKFTDKGRVDVIVSSTYEDADHIDVEISIVDTGIGILEEDQSRLFKCFSQLDSSMTKSYEGTGLGLALSRRLVELLGGKINVESRAGAGSKFFFHLSFRKL